MQQLFNPKSVALIGATNRKGSVGLGIAKNLMPGKNRRKIFFINPNTKKVLGQKTFASVSDVKERIDIAIIAVPSGAVKQVALDCAAAMVGSCIIVSSGFAESGEQGKKLQEEVAEIFKKNSIALVGPNCLGVLNPWANFNGSFSPDTPKPGKIAFVSQSGALIDSIIDKSLLEGFGFSLMISYGNEAGLSLNDFLKIAWQDKKTESIAIYTEEIKNGSDFIEICSEISKQKPVAVLKGGKTAIGKKAVQSHTASLAGDERVYSAAFKKAGLIESETIEDLFLAANVLSAYQRAKRKWAILTNGGAIGVITSDWCSKFSVELSKIPESVFEQIAQSKKINLSFSRNNPLDIIGDASSEGYATALEILLKQEEIGGVIFCQTLQTMTDPKENAKVIIKAQKQFKTKPILPLFLGGEKSQKGADLLRKNKLLFFGDPRDVALAASLLTN